MTGKIREFVRLWSWALILVGFLSLPLVLGSCVSARAEQSAATDPPVRNAVHWRDGAWYFYYFEIGEAKCIAYSAGEGGLRCNWMGEDK